MKIASASTPHCQRPTWWPCGAPRTWLRCLSELAKPGSYWWSITMLPGVGLVRSCYATCIRSPKNPPSAPWNSPPWILTARKSWFRVEMSINFPPWRFTKGRS
ncbi:unnamed protein product [Cladocopium goreaui]|uniref:Uncharacterized protein n=1 Tax=Cladocopium goreaui TaxID=2562237 RepID=A0A9P1DK44_9DINO|nr:unnamed protein product [Cladocopium goreaui]